MHVLYIGVIFLQKCQKAMYKVPCNHYTITCPNANQVFDYIKSLHSLQSDITMDLPTLNRGTIHTYVGYTSLTTTRIEDICLSSYLPWSNVSFGVSLPSYITFPNPYVQGSKMRIISCVTIV